MATNKKQSSDKIAQLAIKILHDDDSSKVQKKLAGSVLAQTNTDKQTSSEMEDFAARVLQSDKYNKDTLSLAASLVAQSNPAR